MMHPVGVEVVMELQDDVVRGRDILQFAHDAMTAIGDRLDQKPAFLLQFDVVGALRGGNDRDHDANNGDEDDDADRRGADRARAAAPSAFTELREPPYSLPPHGVPPKGLSSG